MAYHRMRSCDVTFATSGEIVQATDTVTLSIPAFATEGGKKSSRVTLDVSEKGKTTLESLVNKAEDRARSAYSPLLEIVDKRREVNSGGKKKAEAEDDTPEDEADSEEEEPQDESADEAETPSPDSGFPSPATSYGN